MFKILTIFTCYMFVFIISGCKTKSETPRQIVNKTSQGDLESKKEIGCIGSHEFNAYLTPADLYLGLVKCVENENYKDGAFMYAAAGVYGWYDRLRVTDKTAHQAITVLKMETLGQLSESSQNKFKESLQGILGNPEGIIEVCAELKRIGPPKYSPQYMIQHGMTAFKDSGEYLVATFNSEKAWHEALDGYLHCK